MPIDVRGNLVSLTQRQFADIAYEVVNEAFSTYKEFGALFDESVYRDALIDRLEDAVAEVRIDVAFQDFQTFYLLDILASSGAIFELKAVEKLNSNHRSQLLNYLLLTGMSHGKLINFGPDQVEHEFVNTKLTYADRTNFSVDDREWYETGGFEKSSRNLFLDILHDWGTGLDCKLYKDALFHFLGGEKQLLKKVDVFQNDRCVAQQIIPLCADSTAIQLTTFQNEDSAFLEQFTRLMKATRLKSAQWINVARKTVTFKTLHFSVPNFSV
jgi:GxxExxY protein